MRKSISISEFRKRQDQDYILVDVREPYEHQEFSIEGLNIPLGDILVRKDEITEDKDKELIIYCRSGGRSGMACDMLTAAGFKNVYNLEGGMMAWQES